MWDINGITTLSFLTCVFIETQRDNKGKEDVAVKVPFFLILSQANNKDKESHSNGRMT